MTAIMFWRKFQTRRYEAKAVFWFIVFCAVHVRSISAQTDQVNPTFGVDGIRASYLKESQESEEVKAKRSIARKHLAEFKAMNRWQADQWMKDASYYKSLPTPQLADEVLGDRAIVANELLIYDDVEYAIIVLEEVHPGFKELEGREDVADGILHLCDSLRTTLNPNSDLRTIVRTSITFDQLQRLYDIDSFKDKIHGREREFLKKYLDVVDSYRAFITNFDPEKLGTRLPFFREPCQVARFAMVFAQIVDPTKYSRVESELKSIRWPKEQRLQDLKSFLDLVSERLRPIASTGL